MSSTLTGSVRALLLMAWLLSGLPTPANSQSAASAASDGTNPSGKNILKGQVVNAVTGGAVRRALVRITIGHQPATLTDLEGRFEFHDLPAGPTAINVHKPGFFSEAELSQLPSSEETVEVGPDIEPLILKLTPEGVLFGAVESKNGPMESVPVKARVLRIAGGRKQWEQKGTVITDDEGEFRIANLPPGVYFVSAGPVQDQVVRRSSKAEGYPEAFYLGSPDRERAAPVKVEPGQQVRVDFSLKPSRAFRVSGVIGGVPSGVGVSIEFADQSGEAKFFATQGDAQKNDFEAMVPEGSYVLTARAAAPDGIELSGDIPVNVTSDLTNLRLRLSPLITIPVHFRKEPVAPADAHPALSGDIPGLPLNVRLSPSESSLPDSGGWYGYQNNDPKTGLAVRNVVPGKYSVEISSTDPWYVHSAQCAAVDLLREQLTVPAGASPSPIEIVLRDDSAILRAKIVSGDRSVPGVVLIIPVHLPEQAKAMPVARESEAQMTGLAPGEYNVLALDRVDGVEYLNSQALSTYLGRAQHVVLQPNQNLAVTLELVAVDK
jgi:hypothetical protein